MKNRTKSISILLGLLLVAAITVLAVSGGALTSLAKLFSTSPLAPPPSPTPLRGLQSSPLGTPVPLPETLPSVPVATVAPTIPPPPGYPTDQPWPPQVTPAPPQPTIPPRLFPTPAFRPTLAGQRPAQLQRLWFPYFPDPASPPQLRAVLVDQQGQRWAQEARSIDLRVDPYPPGSVLLNLHPSPNHQQVIADLAFSGSYLIDLDSGASRPVIIDVHTGPGRFLAWSPDSQQVVILPETFPQEAWIMDISSQKHTILDLPRSDFGDSLVRAVAYSPDGRQLADAVVYPAVYAVRDIEMTEIGVRDGESGERRTIAQIPGGTYVVDHSLRWSPDGRKLIWIVNVVTDTTPSPTNFANTQIQLWVADLTSGSVNMLSVLGQAVEYRHPAVWSPDGHYIAVVKVEDVRDGKEVANNVYLFDPVSRAKQQITQFSGRRLSHLAWLPDSQWLALTVTMGDYGEVWTTDLAGTQQYPVAGPAIPDAPFVWFLEGE